VKGVAIEVWDQPLGQCPAPTIVVPVPSNERPLRGPAGWLDWRMCGRLSEEMLAGRLTGSLHEAVLLPGQPPFDASKVMLLGIGAAESLPGRGVQDAFRDLASRLLGLCCDHAIVALPASVDLTQDGESALRGCLQSMSSFRGDGWLHLMVPGGQRVASALRGAADDLCDEADRRRVRLEIDWVPAERIADA